MYLLQIFCAIILLLPIQTTKASHRHTMEAVSAGLGIASFAFQAFQGCIQAIAFYQVAQRIGLDGDLFRVGLEVQKHRLLHWGDRVNLWEDGKQNQKINWDLAVCILEQLRLFLTSAQELARKYSLEITEEEITAVEAQAEGLPERGLYRAFKRLKPDVLHASARLIQSSNGTIKRLRWASVGKDKAKRILDEIGRLIDHLGVLLDSADRQKREEDDAQLFRSLISLSADISETGQVKDLLEGRTLSDVNETIREAAWVKQVRLVIGADRRSDEVHAKPSRENRKVLPVLMKHKRPLRPHGDDPFLRQKGLEFADYNGKQVLVQWKVAEGDDWQKYEENMKCLTVVLMSVCHQSFHALPCYGYHPAQSLGRHGVMFSMPDEDHSKWAMKPLKDLIETCRVVNLTRRVQIGRAIAEAVLQLHTAGWMHKGINSENIIFVAPEGTEDSQFLTHGPYLMGYDYARPDSTAGALITQIPDEGNLYTELYRHPASRGVGRETYQKRFDMYSLGCVLVELAMWEQLVDVQSRYTERNWRQEIDKASDTNDNMDLLSMAGLVQEKDPRQVLKHRVGDRIYEVIERCLTIEKTEVEDHTMLDTQMYVVKVLSEVSI